MINQPTNQPTNGPTQWDIESRAGDLKEGTPRDERTRKVKTYKDVQTYKNEKKTYKPTKSVS